MKFQVLLRAIHMLVAGGALVAVGGGSSVHRKEVWVCEVVVHQPTLSNAG